MIRRIIGFVALVLPARPDVVGAGCAGLGAHGSAPHSPGGREAPGEHALEERDFRDSLDALVISFKFLLISAP
jgi:hypothetical protein